MYRIRFCYTDYWIGKSAWRRIKLNEVEERAKKVKFYNVYSTVQRFENPQHLDGELCWGPLYFDLDAKENIKLAMEDAKKLFLFFSKLGLNKEHIRMYFSGSKGIHVLVEPEVLGIEPHAELSYIFKQIGYNLTSQLELTTLDIQTYSVRRLLRLPDSVHANSGKYKIELYHEELDLPIEKIQEMAKSPRGQLYEPIEYTGLQPQETANLWYKTFTEQYGNEETLKKLKPRNVILTPQGSHPACISFLLAQKQLPLSNTGNKSVLALSAYFKDIEKSYDETFNIIYKWIANVDNCGDAGKENKLKSMVETTVKFIFEKTNDEKYHFACSFIRALGSNEVKIPCDYEKCALIKDPNDQEPDVPIELHLSEASRAEYKDHKLLIPAMVAGKDGAPYIVPKEVVAKCLNEKKDEGCYFCNLKDTPEYHFEFTAKDPELLEFINSSNENIIGIVRKKLHAEKCRYCNIDFKSHCNIETIRLVPVVDDNKYGAQQHVVRVCYFLGHGINLNNKYRVTAYTYTHPKSQIATHLISSVEPYATSLSNFKMSTSLKRELMVFQPSKEQTIWQKFDEIHDDLEANVYNIWGRKTLAFGIDLVYHSVIQFTFHGKLLERGWCELLVVGDSCQGKSETMKRLQKHYGLGEGSSGETATRTGLVYNFQETQNSWMLQWGRIPLNDRGLLYIDEFSGLSDQDISQMSNLRSTGRVVLHGIISDETNARTRLIFLSNTREGRTLNSYNHGVESILGIMHHTEDIRRLDFAMAVASGEVPVELLNRSDIPKKEHQFTSYLCEQLILWAWSRRPEDIVITPDAEKLILKLAMDMSRKYFAKIPLVEPADQRIKLARLSVAVACRLFSCDDFGEKVIVKTEHVQFIHDYLNKIYDCPAMGYDVYSAETAAKSTITDEQKEKLELEFIGFREPSRLREVLLRTTVVSRSFFEDMMGYERDRAKELLRWLIINNLIEGKRIGFVKTPHFIEFLKRLPKENGEDYSGDDTDT